MTQYLKRLGFLISGALFLVPATSSADWKGIHGVAFSCLSSTSSCSGLTTTTGGLQNSGGSATGVFLPLLRDLDGNIDISVYFKAGTSGTLNQTQCWAFWYDTSGAFAGSEAIPRVQPTDQFRNPFVSAPSADYGTVVLCNIKSGAVLVSVLYNEG